MKKLLAALLLIFIIGGHTALAFTDVANFVAASSQALYVANSTSLNVTGDVTWEAWVKFATVPCTSGPAMGIMTKKDFVTSNNRSWEWILGGNGDGTCYTQMDISSDGTNANQDSVRSNNFTPSTGVWYHYAAVHSGSTGGVTFYINEVSQGGTSLGTPQTTIFAGTSPTMVGTGDRETNAPTFANYFNGREFMARIWSTARTTGQLSANACVTLGSTANLAAEWTLDNTTNDDSGNANNLTNFNTVTFPADTACTPPASTAVYLMFQPW